MQRAVSAILLFLLLAPAARADYEETEHRLKEAGVDEALRMRIHSAIDRAVEYLLARQAKSGAFPRGGESRYWNELEVVPLVALALRHAGTPEAMPGVRKALEYLFPPKSRGRSLLHDNIYVAGIALMLLMADGGHRDPAHEIAGRIAGAIDARTGWWGYLTKRGKRRRSWPDVVNLSTTQFAALGLWAGDRLGADTDRKVWRRHLDALLRTQADDGSWEYAPRASPPNGYPCGTFMGTANLLLAMEALEAEIAADDEFRVRCYEVREKAIAALHRDGAALLAKMRQGRWYAYTLYALEKACIFAGTERVGPTLWYRAGATILCDTQKKDGSWGSLADTAFSLLFLLRDSESYRPDSPRTIDAGRGVATEGPEGPAKEPEAPPPAEPAPTPPVARVEIGLGWEILKRLEGLLRENRAENEAILSALSLAGTAYGGLRPDVGDDPEPAEFDSEADRWRVEAERAFVVAAVLSREVRGVEGNPRTDVNVRALTLLGDADPRASPLLVKALERHDGDLQEDVWGEAYATLARLGRPDAFAWIVEEEVTTDRRPDRVARTLGALLALRRFENVDGAVRLDAVKRLTRRFASLEQARDAAGRAIWEEIEFETTETLRHLATDPRTGAGPSRDGAPVGTIGQFTQWLRDHDDPRRPPWRPAAPDGK